MGIFNKIRDFVGFNESVDYEYDYDEMDGQEYQDLYRDEAAPVVQEDDSRARRRLRDRTPLVSTEVSPVNTISNVIDMPGTSNGP